MKTPSFAEEMDDCLARYLAYFNYKSYANGLDLQGNERILEVGSGGGNLSRFLADKIPNGKLVCVDWSNFWIDKSIKRLKDFRNIIFNRRNIFDLNKENYFDVAIFHFVLHDIMNRKKAVDILSKSLKSGGKIYIREPTRQNHGMPSVEIEELMRSAGLNKLQSIEGYFFPLRGNVYEGVFSKKLL